MIYLERGSVMFECFDVSMLAVVSFCVLCSVFCVLCAVCCVLCSALVFLRSCFLF